MVLPATAGGEHVRPACCFAIGLPIDVDHGRGSSPTWRITGRAPPPATITQLPPLLTFHFSFRSPRRARRVRIAAADDTVPFTTAAEL